VTDFADAALRAGGVKVFAVTINAGVVLNVDLRGRRVGLRSPVAEGAILGSRLVLFAAVIEGRDFLDHLRVNNIEGGLADGLDRGRGVGVLDRPVQVLLLAAARPGTDD